MSYKYFVPSGYPRFVKNLIRILKSDETGVVLFSPKMDRPLRISQLIQDYQSEYPLVKIDLAPGHSNDLNYFLPPVEQGLGGKLKKDTGICITNCELMIYENNFDVIEEIMKFQHTQSHYRFLLFFEVDITHPDIANRFSLNEVFNNVIYYPLYDYKDTLNFINYSLQEWGFEIPGFLKEKIIQQCGGQFWLVRQSVRALRDDSEADLGQVFESDEIRLRLDQIYHFLLDSEKKVLQKLIKNEVIEDRVEKHSFDFLNRMGLIRKDKITIPLLENYIQEYLPKVSLIKSESHITLNNVNIEGNFSKKEKKVMRILLDHKNQLVDRDAIAKVLWEETEGSYSDWALDRFIARIRIKLKKLGVSREMIKTLRNKGYMLTT